MTLYVTYFYTTEKGWGIGSMKHVNPTNMLSVKDLEELADEIKRERGYDEVVILNWKEIAW